MHCALTWQPLPRSFPLHWQRAAAHAGSSAAASAAPAARPRPIAAAAVATQPIAGKQSLQTCEDISSAYELGREVGRGSFAIVLEATNHQTGDRLCAKKLPKFKHNSLPEQQTAAVAAEADTQRVLSAASSAILRFREVRQDSSYYYLISELCVSDLSRYLADQGPLPEREAAHILRQLLEALATCHRHGVAFLDVKPANLLIRSLDSNALPEVVLADFGCCRSTYNQPPSNRISAGTPLYSAPECVHGQGGQESDVWSAGILLFNLLSGLFPFCSPSVPISQGEYWRRVAEQPILFAGPAWHATSPGAVSLLHRMLDRDCSSRITAAEALQDPWLLEMTSSRGAPPPSPSRRNSMAPGAASNVLPGLPHHHHTVPAKAAHAAV